MTARAFTQAQIERAVAGSQRAGLTVSGVKVEPDGSIVILTGGVTAPQKDNTSKLKPKPWPKED